MFKYGGTLQKQKWLFFFFLNMCNHTMINCEDLHISNLKKNTVFRPKISQAKKRYFFSAETLASPVIVFMTVEV